MNSREAGWERVEWIHLTQSRDQWRVLVNAVMKLKFPQKPENFLTS